MPVLDEDTITLVCRAGHEWTIPRPRRGKWPEYCAEHKRFFLEQLSGRLKPPTRVRQEWAEQGKMMGDEDYVKYWTKAWTKVVRLLGARGGSWNSVDIRTVEDYIRALRMAELHRLYAQDRPYIESDRGTMKPHPGFELAKESDAEARRLAVELGLQAPTNEVTTNHVPAPQRRESRERRESAADYFNTRLQEEAEDVGEVEHPTGPDGEPL